MAAAGRSLEMKIPSRPAPAPPGSSGNTQTCRSSSQLQNFDNCDPFLDRKYSRSETTLTERRKPPPRPPPPKLQAKSVNRRQAPTQLLSNLFGRKPVRNGGKPEGEISSASGKPAQTNHASSLAGYGSTAQAAQPIVSVPSATLIDLNSPPASPTLTARSSSDGVESGFEDDFDFFNASSTTTPTVSDPWGNDADPFSPVRRASPHLSMPPTIYEDVGAMQKKTAAASVTNQASAFSMPTIIRASKGGKPARPPPIKVAQLSRSSQSRSQESNGPDFLPSMSADDAKWSSPPMPSMPPPPPPPEALDVLLNGPQLPPRPTSLIAGKIERKKPYCIAQYDYEATHPEDLSFKVNDVISLISRANAEWLRGQLMGKEGIFPESFVNVVVPLDEEPADSFDNDTKVIALYTFTPETWDDLSFQEGETVRILRRVNDDWLYGECNGRRGQFPAGFVSALYLDVDS